MNNHPACDNIEHLLYLTNDEMDQNEQHLLTDHLLSCSSCREAHETFLNNRRAVILANPVADYPDFEIRTGANPNFTASTKILRMATLVSGIAAALLIGLFIWEQSVSVVKISHLETHIQSVKASSLPALIDKMTVQAAFRDKEWKEFWVMRDLNHSLSDPIEKVKVRAMIEQRLRNPDRAKAGLGKFFGNSLLANQYALTYKNLIR